MIIKGEILFRPFYSNMAGSDERSKITVKKIDTRKKRGYFALIIVSLLSVSLLLRVGYIQVFKGDDYKAKAESQQLSDTQLSAARGTIYDSDMNILAKSASVWLAYMNPSKINNISNEKTREETRELIIENVSKILDIDKEKLRGYTELNYSYQLLKSKIEKETKDELTEFISKNKLGNIICIDPDTKRYYPYGTLASSVIGFTDTDGKGRYGLEAYYDDELSGVAGRRITTRDGMMSELPNKYETTYDAQNGLDLVLTLDSFVQHSLESSLTQALEDTNASYAYGIVMDVDTGAILGMASLPDYDLNDPYTITDQRLVEKINEITDKKEKSEAELTANYSQWRNRAVSDTYEPGSVFKVITASAAIEEGVADLNTSYYCSGSIDYATRHINCWKHGGHGSETFVDLLKNSCNPFAVTLASELGQETYYKYFDTFGLTEATGVDLPAESSPAAGILYKSESDFTKSDLASYSFGQSFKVTPIQMITAISAVANGGNLMTPYIVDKTVDQQGNTVSKTQPVVKRQVISEDTAKIIRSAMEQVVSSGTGKNAYVPGYHVAGKTGTSEKLEKLNAENGEEVYIASFCGFAPADDPEIAVLIIVDEPVGDHGGGAIAAPVACRVFEQILPSLGVDPVYSDEELESLAKTAPNLVGLSVSEAKSSQNSGSITVTVVGDGDKVVSQYPESGRSIPSDGVIVVYTDSSESHRTVTVPDFTGMTVSQANYAATNSGLNIRISGSNNSSAVYAYKQSIEKNTQAEMGEVITVYFKTNVDVSD